MNEIEYVFGTGDGLVHVWTSQADLELGATGGADAVRLDFDGDGSADDALWDSSGSGVADIAALDLDDDGVLDHFFTDPTGLGTWNHQITGLPGDAASEPLDWIVRTEQEMPDRLVAGAQPPDAHPDTGHPAALSERAQVDALPEHLAHWSSRNGRSLGDEPFIV
ncbi:hypothetical protein IU459_00730 [Nocardia amamiensis]|uniref:Uncharacterized protein n=1 Tax=Nocardia amamiensis TaxID=404578 RepID=A0ABS0CHJ6_9NOCA|nr:hypothetical protein [Nocardia amamiensis]MBF6296064.1 hypothetical protein [Nocardia amamiensis]